MSSGNNTGIIFDIERFAIHDGPGIRTVVFFKGCTLRCKWCQNPEGISPKPELLYREGLCIGCGKCAACRHDVHAFSDAEHRVEHYRCAVCGTCAVACPTQALAISGRASTAEEALKIVLRDRIYYSLSAGGLTLSGGEPLIQPHFARALLEAAKAEGLHTAVETAGSVPWSAFEAVADSVDLFLYDLKDTDRSRHKLNTGGDLQTILGNLRRLDSLGKGTWLRCPIIPGVNDTPEHRKKVAEIRNSLSHCEKLEMIPYHRLGHAKWLALGLEPEVFGNPNS